MFENESKATWDHLNVPTRRMPIFRKVGVHLIFFVTRIACSSCSCVKKLAIALSLASTFKANGSGIWNPQYRRCEYGLFEHFECCPYLAAISHRSFPLKFPP